MRAFLYAPASGHGGQRLQGAGGRLFSISIRTHQPPFEMEDNYDDYQPETVLPLYDRKCDAGSFGRDRRHPLYGRPPVRYKKDPENKKRWIVDEEAAAVVQKIFALCMDGMGPTQIAKWLQENKVLSPVA